MLILLSYQFRLNRIVNLLSKLIVIAIKLEIRLDHTVLNSSSESHDGWVSCHNLLLFDV